MGRRAKRKVYARGGKWWGVIPREGGESSRESLGIPTSAPETEAMALWLERARGQRAADATAATPRVGEAFDDYLDEQRRRGRSEATREIDDAKAGHFVRMWGRGMPLRLITAKVVSDFVKAREDEGAKHNTVVRELVVLRGMLKLAIHRGRFSLPLERVMPLGYRANYKPIERWITQEVARRMLVELPPKRRGWFAFALATGARRSEIDRALHADISEDEVLIRGTKTASSHDTVPITSIQRPWLETASKRASKDGPAFGGWPNVLRGLRHAADRLSTCPRCRAGKRRDRRARGTPDKHCEACQRISRVPHVTPNDLRRSLGHWLRDGGVEPHLIAKVLRHTDSRMAERVYARGSKAGVLSLIEAQLAIGKGPRGRRPQRKGARQ